MNACRCHTEQCVCVRVCVCVRARAGQEAVGRTVTQSDTSSLWRLFPGALDDDYHDDYHDDNDDDDGDDDDDDDDDGARVAGQCCSLALRAMVDMLAVAADAIGAVEASRIPWLDVRGATGDSWVIMSSEDEC
jgi:hypothetical protein